VTGDKILIVDDEATNVEIFDLMLSKLGFCTETASDGVEALDKLRSFRPALILLDNMMPRMTGWEVTRSIKHGEELADYRGVSIIMFSAADDVEDKVQGLELGVDDYITKPFNFTEVLARIRAVLHRRHLQEQVTRREHRIGVIESLNESLIFFSQHVRRPLERQLQTLDEAAAGDVDSVALGTFANRVKDDARAILAKLDALEQEIGDLQRQGDELKAGDLSIEELHRRLAGIASAGVAGS
jgi:DNA-binding response OmpR family regulator